MKQGRFAGRTESGSVFVAAAILLFAGLAWAVLLSTPDMPMRARQSFWSAREAAAFVAMWGVMMAAMMLPSAMPMILLYRTVSLRLRHGGDRAIPATLFAAVYLGIWLLTGAPVYAASAIIQRFAANSLLFRDALPYMVGMLLLAAGAYQLGSFKHECLRKCKTPLQFLTERWRSGYAATFGVALRHAFYCLGCCAALMTILVGAGAMNILWVLIITVVVFAEKVLPHGEWTARVAGGALIAAGVAVLLNPDIERSIRSLAAR